MGRTITSIIEIQTEGSTMKTRKQSSENPNDTQDKSRKHRSKAGVDKNRFFHSAQSTNDGVTQNVNVTVTVEQPKDDCMTSCFSALGACFGKGAKGAAT